MPISFLSRLFGFGPDPKTNLRPLWHRTVEIAREPHWFAQCKVADTLEGRFDMIVAVMSVVLIRMEQDEELLPPSVLLTELFVDDMDGQLRESGVGDVVVGKKMGKLMSSLGGRLGAYRDGLRADDASLAEAVERNIEFTDGGNAQCVADGLRTLSAQLRAASNADILEGNIAR